MVDIDTPAAVSNLYLVRDRGCDLASGFPVYMYPHGREIHVLRLYANLCGLLPGEVCLPVECVLSWMLQRRICVPSFLLRATRHQDEDDWLSIRLELLRRVADCTLRF